MMFQALALVTNLALAQDCYAPDPGYGAHGVAWGPNGGTVQALAVFDDGRGDALYMGGKFSIAGEIQADSLARFDGVDWEALPGPGGESIIDPTGFGIQAMAVFDDGTGDALYVAGSFKTALGLPDNGVVRWDGVSWAPVFQVSTQFAGFHGVSDLVVWDDGSGGALYFGGTFNKVDGNPVASVGKWTASGVATLGSGYLGSLVDELEVHDFGAGERLVAAGWGAPGQGTVRAWDGSGWSDIGADFNSIIGSMAVHDDGTGATLYVGGSSSSPGGRVVRWNGTAWETVGTPPMFFPETMTSFDDGGGSELYAFGTTYSVPPLGWEVRAARWDGTSWSNLGTGLNGDGWASLVVDLGSGSELIVGGSFNVAGNERADHVARWTSAGWDALSTSDGFMGAATALEVVDDGSGASLFTVGGASYLPNQDPETLSRVLRWSSGDWVPVGGDFEGSPAAFVEFDDGGGPRLYACGVFEGIAGQPMDSIARWNGGQWESLAGGGLRWSAGFVGSGQCMAVHDFGAGPRLVVGGSFDLAGGVPVNNVAVWDGSTWAGIGTGLDGDVAALEVFDDGTSGPRLFVGGHFHTAGPKIVKNFAVWDGAAWQRVLSSMDREVRVMRTLDYGEGPRLVVGGDFINAGGTVAIRVAAFDGQSFSAFLESGQGITPRVEALEVFDFGGGPELIVGGRFSTAGGKPIAYAARWTGAAWEPFDEAPSWNVDALANFDDGSGPALFLGGWFDSMGSTPSLGIARVAQSCGCAPVPYCTPKPNSLGCLPTAYATGSTSLTHNTLRIRVRDVLNNKPGILFWGTQPAAIPFQGGTLCVSPPITRTTPTSTGGNPPPNDCSGSLAFHWNQPYVASQGITTGEWYYAQYWSRDPASPSTTSLSDAVRFVLCP